MAVSAEERMNARKRSQITGRKEATVLWNREELSKDKKDEERSFVHLLSQYFTIILFSIATITAVYWAFTDSGKIWNAVTAVLIVACPSAFAIDTFALVTTLVLLLLVSW